MMYYLLKLGLSALLITVVSEVAKRSSTLGGLIASLPLVSLLSFIWVYAETRDVKTVIDLSTSVFWFVLPSLVLFLVLPLLLKRDIAFYPALGLSCLATMAAYVAMIFVLGKASIKL